MKWLNTVAQWDVRLFLLVNSVLNTRAWFRFSRAISATADGYLYLILPPLMAVAGFIPWAWLPSLALAFVAERTLYFILKNGLKRNRPADFLPSFRSLIIPSDQFSFPSGHSSAAFLFAGFLAIALPGLAPVFFMWAAMVAASRVMLGVHFPGDVVVGAAMGLFASQLLKGVLV